MVSCISEILKYAMVKHMVPSCLSSYPNSTILLARWPWVLFNLFELLQFPFVYNRNDNIPPQGVIVGITSITPCKFFTRFYYGYRCCCCCCCSRLKSSQSWLWWAALPLTVCVSLCHWSFLCSVFLYFRRGNYSYPIDLSGRLNQSITNSLQHADGTPSTQ